MNDLNAEGCTFRDTKDAWSVEEVMKGVEQLAGLHAQYWGAKLEDHPCKFAWNRASGLETSVQVVQDGYMLMILRCYQRVRLVHAIPLQRLVHDHA